MLNVWLLIYKIYIEKLTYRVIISLILMKTQQILCCYKFISTFRSVRIVSSDDGQFQWRITTVVYSKFMAKSESYISRY